MTATTMALPATTPTVHDRPAAWHDHRCRPDLASPRGPRRVRRRPGAVRRQRRQLAAPGPAAPAAGCLRCRLPGRARGSARSPTTWSTIGRPGSSPWPSGSGSPHPGPCSRRPSSSPMWAWIERVGYGLKLPSSFHDTHLGRMGRARREPRSGSHVATSRSSPPAESSSRPAASTRSRCWRSRSASASGRRPCTSGSPIGPRLSPPSARPPSTTWADGSSRCTRDPDPGACIRAIATAFRTFAQPTLGHTSCSS